MGYITSEYYNNTFKGADAGEELEVLIERASDTIDFLTGHKLVDKDFETEVAEFLKQQVKKATASQVEYYVLNGGLGALEEDAEQVSLGNFSYQGKSTDKPKKPMNVSNNALRYLSATGLLYNGVGTYG